jgi:pyruvate/2-oxoacid:ferredoxin oxidoreductase beta subunit
MPVQRVKFYQTGSFAVGNRLLDADDRSVQAHVIGQGGDGGTVDIGFGCLSGLFERNDDVLFVSGER